MTFPVRTSQKLENKLLMPISLPSISRRSFLTQSLAAGTGSLLAERAIADNVKVDPYRFALLSDPHISGNHEEHGWGKYGESVNMFDNLQKVGREVLASDRRPAGVMINGDCALYTGKSIDYTAVLELVKPLREEGLPIHLTLGNHDHRERFWEAIPPTNRHDRAVTKRHVTVVKSPRANWFLLDSLQEGEGKGLLGAEQLTWLAKSLDAHADKPALIMAHHNTDDQPRHTGHLIDTEAMLKVLVPRKQVKAYFFGHIHEWHVHERAGLHMVSLPATSYPFRGSDPTGWVDAHLTPTGVNLELRCIDTDHAEHGQKINLKWRS